MQARGYFSHTSPDGSTLADRVRAAGYTDRAGENLLKGTVTPAQAVTSWIDSPTHRAILLDPAYRGIGIAQGGEYWTQTAGEADPPGGGSRPEGPVGSEQQSTPDAQGDGGDGGSGPAGAPSPEGTTGLGVGSGPAGNGGSAGASGSSSEAAGPFPAKFRAVRAHVHQGRLNAFASVSRRTNGDAVRVSFIASGRRFSFTERIQEGRLRLSKRLPESQRAASTGIMEIHYAGNERVRPDEVRMRAARRSARFEPQLLSLGEGVLHARGTISRRARGVVRVRLVTGAGEEWNARAPIADGTWQLRATLPPEVREGGYLTIQFTGYRPARIRGGQIAKEVLAGQSFVGG